MVFDFALRTSIVLYLIGFYIGTSTGLYQTRPHIIVIMADDLGWNDVGFHGSNQIPTPNIDALGYNGVILNRHYVLPSCTPSRTAFFTGKYPIRMGMQGDGIQGGEPRGLPLNVRILPEHLRRLGYVTKLIGKWHVGFHTPQHTPLHRGFDSFLGFYNSYITYYDYKYSQGNMTGFDLHSGDDPAYGLHGIYATDLFTEEALRIIDHHDPQRPLYLQISHLAVHAPVEMPPEDYNNKDFSHIHEHNRRKYAAMVAQLDNSLGRVVASLGDKGMLKDSLILFLSDNGAASIGKFRNWGSNYPLKGTKYTLYEGGVRGVAALWSPRLHQMAYVSENLIHITDWLPTFYAAAGGDLKDLGDIDGINQWPALGEDCPPTRDSLLLNVDEVSKTEGAIHGRYKIIRGSVKRGYYDGYHGESGRNRDVPLYNTTRVLRSAVSRSITAHLGGPVTQPSAMITLRQKATVQCYANATHFIRHNSGSCNETECLFDIVNDPCEIRNIAKEYPRMVTQLDLFLEKYGNVLMKQAKLPIDWMANPRGKNNTWEPWLNPGAMLYAYASAATAISTLAVCAHLGMALLIVGLRVFI
ncbi:arylsulfatase B [Orussus abietinus]|uniref:arylsulfatase B n=1 Tax=Orussus abietinus TaxID=222816 RepID=UPI00062609BC|nr:arylsulfatase B [Orussus abietinus]